MTIEGRGWHNYCVDKLRPNMKTGKVYLYQAYTTCFVEFDSLEECLAFRGRMFEIDKYWDYEPIITIDLINGDIEKLEKLWGEFIE